MNDQQFNDLKQFIGGRISQMKLQLSHTEQSIKQKLREEVQQLRQEMHDGFIGVGEALE